MTIEDLLELINDYPDEDKMMIRKAYDYAKELHKGQYRQSGEEYITHPLNVAYILADMHADKDTICAGLLHDTLEDTKVTKEDIAHEFNKDVANLVDGVTKLAKMNFASKQDQNNANTRKIITGIMEDVRIIIIKLADRLHNMRTLQYKTLFKQQENSLETMELFVPLAYYIGAYRIKSELEDLSLRYLKPEAYKLLEEKQIRLEMDNKEILEGMSNNIKNKLLDNDIESEIKIRTKNIYGLYKYLYEQRQKISNIHDLFSLKIMVDSVKECYISLGLIHELYHPVPKRFKDYICNPKSNMYQSLHTTVFAPDNLLVQTQIRTHEMDMIASFGLPSYFKLKNGNTRILMQEDLKEKCQFYKSLMEIDSMFHDNDEFVKEIKKEVFSEKVYAYTPSGERIELPKNSTVVDFAYYFHPEIGNSMIGAIVNDEAVGLDYVIKNNDRVKIITDDLAYGAQNNLLEFAHTNYARRRIINFDK